MKLADFDQVTSNSVEETVDLASRLLPLIKDFTAICLVGNLGAGKTLLAKTLISELLDLSLDEITSPTFNYMNIYSNQITVCHFDLYRLTSLKEFIDLGFEDYLFDTNTLSIIEWPDHILSLLPEKTLFIKIDHLEADSRLITFAQREAH